MDRDAKPVSIVAYDTNRDAGAMTATHIPRRPTETVLAAVLAVIFMLTGATKVIGLPMMADQFAGWGYPLWFMYAVGIGELAGAGLLVPFNTRRFGAFLIGIVMVGAVATHIRASEFALTPVPLVVLLIALWLLRPRVEPPARGEHDPQAAGAERSHAAMSSR